MKPKTQIAFAAAAMLALAAAGVAYAKDTEQDTRDAKALLGMTMTLPQAIATAEQQTGGRAVGADVSREGDFTLIAVEIAGPQGVTTVHVDGRTGRITASRASGDGETDD